MLSDVVSSFVRLTKKGQELWGCCPFHQEKTPSFKVNNENGTFHCFGCGVGGDVIAFWQEKTGASFTQTVQELSQKAGLTPPKNAADPILSVSPLHAPLEVAGQLFYEELQTDAGQSARAYLTKRHISQKAIDVFQLGITTQTNALNNAVKAFSQDLLIQSGLYSQQGNTLSPHFKARLMFPLKDRAGRTIGFGGRTLTHSKVKYINSPETPLFLKKNYLYGLYEARRNNALRTKPLVLVEGYFDVIALQMAGLARALSPLGTAFSDEQLHEAWRLNKVVHVCFDGDAAGLMAAFKLAERSLPLITTEQTLQFIWLPDGEDPHSLLCNNQHKEWESRCAGAHPLVDVLLSFLVHLYPLKTPESQVNAKAHIHRWAERIAAPDLRTHYRRILLDKLWQRIRGKLPSTPIKPALPNPEKARQIGEKIVLLTVINHPALLFDYMETLATLPLSAPNASVRDFLLNLISRWDSPPTPETLKEALQEKHINVVDPADKTSHLLLYAPFARQSAPEENARRGLVDLLDYFSKNEGLRQDILEAEMRFAQNLHEDAWQRLCELRRVYRRSLCETSEGM